MCKLSRLPLRIDLERSPKSETSGKTEGLIFEPHKAAGASRWAYAAVGSVGTTQLPDPKPELTLLGNHDSLKSIIAGGLRKPRVRITR